MGGALAYLFKNRNTLPLREKLFLFFAFSSSLVLLVFYDIGIHNALCVIWLQFVFVISCVLSFFKKYTSKEKNISCLVYGSSVVLVVTYCVIGLNLSDVIRNKQNERYQLCSWVEENTPKNSLFLIPPDLEEFRLYARRSIIVDIKAFPFDKKSICEWYRRILDISGQTPSSTGDAVSLYNSLNKKRVNELKQKYGFDFLIVKNDHYNESLNEMPCVFESKAFKIFSI